MKINKLIMIPILTSVATVVVTPVILTSCVERVYLILDTIDPKLKDEPNNIRVHAALTNGYGYPHFTWSFS
ncbi:hypothetical protein FACS1894166_02190 [Bacilli bacterium]|nr:hypothetical protein FACS1894166_02190 [Bacilli bacterium]